MSIAAWYIVAVSLGTGAAIPIWWAVAIKKKSIPELTEGRKDIWFHIAAELATAAVLIAAAIATIADDASATGKLLSAFGLGMLGYSLVHSPGPAYDRKDKRLLATFAFSWLFAVPAMILRFVAR